MTSTKAAAQDAARTAAAAAKKKRLDSFNGAIGDILTGGVKAIAMKGLEYVAGVAYEGNRAICDDPNSRIIEKTFCMVMKGLSGGGTDDSLNKNIDKIVNTLNEVNAKVTQINDNVKALLKEMDLVHLEIAEAVVGAEAYAAIQAIQVDYPRYITSIQNLQDHPDRTLAYYTELITETKLHRKIDIVFNALVSGVANKPSLLGNIMQQIETKGPNDDLLMCYRIYQEYVNSILLDLRKGNLMIASALLYFETLKQNGKLTPELAKRLADLGIGNQIWRKQWDAHIDTMLDHYNTNWERFAINRAVAAGEPLPGGAQPSAAQGINPFFFPEDAREAFRTADAFCALQQDKPGLRGRVFSMGGQFDGALKFKDGSQAAAAKTATFAAGRKVDYWTADPTGVFYNKVQFSDQWTVHRYYIAGAAAGAKKELNIALPYTPPAVGVANCDLQTAQPSSAEGAKAFGSFVEIARAGGTFAFLSGAWSPGRDDRDDSNTNTRPAVQKVEELRDVPEFKIRHQQVAIGKIGRPEVGLRKGGPLLHNLKSHSLEGRFRTWLETAKTIEFPATSPNEHVALCWSIGVGHRPSALGDTAKFNSLLRGPDLRPTQPKTPVSDADLRSKPFIMGVNFDPTFAIPDQGCRLRTGVRLYPIWDGQNAELIWNYPAINGGAGAGRIQVGVFREDEDTDTSMTRPLAVELYNSRKLKFRFETFYESRVETSGLDLTPFFMYSQAELENAYVELRPGPGGTTMDPKEVALTNLLRRPAAQCFSFDYDQNGFQDHVMLYDAGYLMPYGQVGSNRFELRPVFWGASRDWEMKSTADRVFEFDYESTGKRDHMVVYRPGEGKISILHNNHGVNETVWKSTSGLPVLNLMNAADRGFAFDFKSKGMLDHLVFYRPGQLCVYGRQSSGGFGLVLRSDHFLGDYRLDGPGDRVFAYDHDGKKCMDHLVIYRPGTGKVSIVKPFGQRFDTVFNSDKGIGGWDLGIAADRALAFDCDGTGRMEYLVFYRPGKGAIFIFKKNDKGTFDLPVYRYNMTDRGTGIGGYDLALPADQILAFDYNGTGQSDHLMLYRPGVGSLMVVKKKDKTDAKEFVKVFG